MLIIILKIKLFFSEYCVHR